MKVSQCSRVLIPICSRKTSSETLNVSLNQLEQITKHPKFEANKPVTLFFHGFRNKQNTSAVRKIVKAYTTFCGHNLIVLDWADAAAGSYFEAFSNVEPVSCLFWPQVNHIFEFNPPMSPIPVGKENCGYFVGRIPQKHFEN